MRWEEPFNLAISSRGYLVMGSVVPLAIGHRLEWLDSLFGHTDHPFTIIAQTDYEDAKAQTILWGLRVSDMTLYNYYYRVTTD